MKASKISDIGEKVGCLAVTILFAVFFAGCIAFVLLLAAEVSR